MKRQQAITIGPFFAKEFSDLLSFGPIQPLNLVLEWATGERAILIPLFRGGGPHDQNQIRLHHILLRREDLPCDLQCPAYQVVTSDTHEFLPLDALLAALFQGDQIRRPVFSILKELNSVIPLTSGVTAAIKTSGLLVPRAEALGFRVNAAFDESGTVFVHIGWEPEEGAVRFHVCAAGFTGIGGGKIITGQWLISREVGVSEILAQELHRSVPGNPTDVLTERAVHFLNERL